MSASGGAGNGCRRKASPNEQRIKRWERECRRRGEHIPWVRVGGFSSTGMQHRVRGLDDGLVGHYHSNGEEALFLRLAFAGGTVRILSQVPLTPLAEVRSLAATIGARMPWDPDHKDWAVLSTDIVVERIIRGSVRQDA